MAEATDPQIESVKCPICWDTYTRPRSLPCLHTFCDGCLRAHIARGGQSQYFSYFHCPVCRADTKPPKPYSERSSWADQFPVNHWVVSMLEEIEQQQQKSRLSCENHVSYDLELYCKDHDCICCPMCVATDHRRCQDVLEIEKLMKEKTERAENSTALLTTLTDLQDDISELKKSRQEENESMKLRSEELVKTICEQKQMIVEHFEVLERDLLCSMNEKYQDLFESIEDDLSWCSEAEVLLNEFSKDSKSISNPTSTEEFIKLHKARTAHDRLRKIFEKRNTELPDYMLLLNEDLVTIPDTFVTFGEIKDTTENQEDVGETKEDVIADNRVKEEQIIDGVRIKSWEITQDEPSSLDAVQCAGESVFYDVEKGSKRKLKALRVAPSGRYNLTLPSEHKCWITGMECMKDKKVIVCDHSNSRVKIFKDDGGSVCENSQFTTPWCVTMVTEKRAVVSYPDEKMVRLFDIKINDFPFRALRKFSGPPLKYLKSLSLDASCYGLAVCGNVVVVCCEQSLKILSLSGRELQTVSKTSSGENLFCKSVYVASNDRLSTCYITDEGKGSVISFKLQTSLRKIKEDPEFVFSHKDLKSPRGICVDTNGRIFVADFTSKHVLQLSPAGELVQIFCTEVRPWAIAFSRAGRLLVSTYPEPDSQFHVYCYF